MGDWRTMDDHELKAVEIREMRADAMKAELHCRVYAAYITAALSKLAEYGWLPFGTNVDNGPVEMVFSAQVDEAGDPYFERVTS